MVKVEVDIVKLGFGLDMRFCCVGCFGEQMLQLGGNIMQFIFEFVIV